jgi:hypothetical protein
MPEPYTDARDTDEDPENEAGFEARLRDQPSDPTASLAWRLGWQEADLEWSGDKSVEF